MTHVEIKSSNGITLVPLDSRLISNRKVFLEGEINSESACDFVRTILHLNEIDPKKPIDVLINSPGGEINSGMLIYDVIQSSKAPIRLFCVGKAYSMGALLFASGKHGRYMLPHSELMLHEPLLDSRIGGNCSSVQSISDSLVETKRKMNEILAKHTGKDIDEIDKATSYNHFFSPEESIEFGLCDEVVDFIKIMED